MSNLQVTDNVYQGFFCAVCTLTPDELAAIQNKEEDLFGEAKTMECCDPEERFVTEEGILRPLVFPGDPGYRPTPEELALQMAQERKVQEKVEEPEMSNEAVLAQLKAVLAELEQLRSEKTATTAKEVNSNVKKNQRPGKASVTRKYVLLTKNLEMWGRVPRQQEDLAKLLSRNLEVGKEYSEPEVFDLLIDQCGEFPSLTSSKQDVTYLFRYYRGLKKDDKHAGFVARNFIKQIN